MDAGKFRHRGLSHRKSAVNPQYLVAVVVAGFRPASRLGPLRASPVPPVFIIGREVFDRERESLRRRRAMAIDVLPRADRRHSCGDCGRFVVARLRFTLIVRAEAPSRVWGRAPRAACRRQPNRQTIANLQLSGEELVSISTDFPRSMGGDGRFGGREDVTLQKLKLFTDLFSPT